MSLTDEDKAAITSLLRRYVKAFDLHQTNLWWEKTVDEWLAQDAESFERLHTAFSLYGLNTRPDGDGFAQMELLFGPLAYHSIISEVRLENARLLEAQTQPKAPDPAPAAQIEAPGIVAGTVRELVLKYLQSIAPDGAKAADIRKHVTKMRGGAELHEKTIGMTCYRLSLEGLAKRDGRTWFFVPQAAGAKNPGDGAPGRDELPL